MYDFRKTASRINISIFTVWLMANLVLVVGFEQVELFCVGNLINCVLEADEEFLCMDFHFTLRDGGMRATFQLLHMVLEVIINVFVSRYWLVDPCPTDQSQSMIIWRFD